MRQFLKSTLITTAIALGTTSALVTAPAYAADELNLTSASTQQAGLAVQGYDVIAYRTDAGPTLGSAEFSADYNGATYRFVSQANLDRFNADPARYVPAYGGFCAYGVSKSKKLEIDPTAYSVVDDVLYLNFNKRIQRRWSKKQDQYIDQAETNWPEIESVAIGDL